MKAPSAIFPQIKTHSFKLKQIKSFYFVGFCFIFLCSIQKLKIHLSQCSTNFAITFNVKQPEERQFSQVVDGLMYSEHLSSPWIIASSVPL